MTTTETANPTTTATTISIPRKFSSIMSGEEWLKADFSAEESEIVVGTADNSIIRPRTKNFVEAPEKSFKTTYLLRFALGISTGESVFPSLHVNKPRRVLYVHGELASAELKERLQAASVGLRRPLDNFYQGRSVDGNLITSEGQKAIEDLVKEFRPEVLVLDPWQSYIAGAEENGFKDQSLAMRYLDRLIETYGLTLLIAIHQGKDRSRGARGHSSLGGWRDSRFTLKRTDNELVVNVEPRWGMDVKVTLNFKYGTVWEGVGPRWNPQAEEIRQMVIANGGQLSRDQLGLAWDLDRRQLRMPLKRAQDSGAIDVDGDLITLPNVTTNVT